MSNREFNETHEELMAKLWPNLDVLKMRRRIHMDEIKYRLNEAVHKEEKLMEQLEEVRAEYSRLKHMQEELRRGPQGKGGKPTLYSVSKLADE